MELIMIFVQSIQLFMSKIDRSSEEYYICYTMIITFLSPYITFLLETQWYKNDCNITYNNWYYIIQYAGFLLAFAPYYIVKVYYIIFII